eukprot:1114651-Rhodomonas_salina.2
MQSVGCRAESAVCAVLTLPASTPPTPACQLSSQAPSPSPSPSPRKPSPAPEQPQSCVHDRDQNEDEHKIGLRAGWEGADVVEMTIANTHEVGHDTVAGAALHERLHHLVPCPQQLRSEIQGWKCLQNRGLRTQAGAVVKESGARPQRGVRELRGACSVHLGSQRAPLDADTVPRQLAHQLIRHARATAYIFRHPVRPARVGVVLTEKPVKASGNLPSVFFAKPRLASAPAEHAHERCCR